VEITKRISGGDSLCWILGIPGLGHGGDPLSRALEILCLGHRRTPVWVIEDLLSWTREIACLGFGDPLSWTHEISCLGL